MTTDARRLSGAQTGAQRRDERRHAVRNTRYVLRVLRRHPLGVLGGALLTAIVTAAMLAPAIAPYGPTEFLPYGPYTEPGPGAVLGTDQLGRDLLTRILYGARTSLAIAAVATLLGVGAGATIGLVSGYLGGRLDLFVQRAMDVMDAFPSLVLAILFVAMLGPSARNVTIAVAFVLIPNTNRVARAVTLSLRRQTFVEAAMAVGASPLRVMTRHMAPGLLAPLTIVAASAVASTIVTEASLSFLGLGPPPPTATWGQMLSGEVRQHFVDAPWLAFFPGLALSLTVFSISMLGDTLRDVLDPRTK
jgi:ABC-type dipeptide/oligopeptide/nickel transport system permease subunit